MRPFRKLLKYSKNRTFNQLRRYLTYSRPFSSKYPILSHTYRKRYYSNFNNHNNDNELLMSKLKNGTISKTEVARIILNNESLKSQMNKQNNKSTITGGNNESIKGSPTIQQMSTSSASSSSSTSLNNRGINIFAASQGGGSGGDNYDLSRSIVPLGKKGNPIFMKKSITLKEFLLSLFPFLFIFWMLGGFDVVKNRKSGGPMGGMFGNNYSEWDETDWEDEEDLDENDLTDENNESIDTNILKNSPKENLSVDEKEELRRKTDEKSKKNKLKKTSSDEREDFFSKLGIDLNKFNKDNKDKETSENGTLMNESSSSSSSTKKKKQKRVRFSDVCGNEEAKLDLQDLVDYLKNPEKYQKMGCKLPKGVLLSGDPGTGKTLLARALAGEAGVPFLATNGASFDEIFVGVGVMRVRKLFQRAKEKAPCIIFIDEIDSIANTRMQMGTAHSSDSLNALLGEMDGFEQNTGIIIIAATNMPDRLDPALVRPGRFDRKIHVQLPDKEARKAIVELYLKDRGSDDVNIDLLVSDISGFSGAELESMVNIASIEAVKLGQNTITMNNLIEAKEIIAMGRARRSMNVSMKTKTVTAFHESGHAIVSLYTKGSKPIYKATVLPRGQALGFVASSNQDEFMATKQSLLAELDTCMGGRAAEEIFNGRKNITTGASSDFNQATRIATSMVCQYGMSPIVGKVFYRLEDISKLSPKLQNLINSEVKRILDESYERSKNIILKHQNELKLLAETLLEKETLSGDEIRDLIKWDPKQQIEPKELYEVDNNDNNNNNNKKRSFNLQNVKNNIKNITEPFHEQPQNVSVNL